MTASAVEVARLYRRFGQTGQVPTSRAFAPVPSVQDWATALDHQGRIRVDVRLAARPSSPPRSPHPEHLSARFSEPPQRLTPAMKTTCRRHHPLA